MHVFNWKVQRSVLHELEICGFNLISVQKNEPLWLPYTLAESVAGKRQVESSIP